MSRKCKECNAPMKHDGYTDHGHTEWFKCSKESCKFWERLG